MNEATREWQSRKWRVAVADSPTNGHIVNCKTLIGALYTAAVYRQAFWKTRIFRNGRHDAKEIMADLKARWKS
jgi:hypothetical protein